MRSGGRSKSENFQNVISANTYTTNNYHIISTTQSLEDNEIKIWINQEKLTTTGTVNFGLNAYNDDFGTRHTIGAAAGKVNYLRGDIAEILLYNTVLNDQKRQQVEQYLNYKWLKH